MRLFSSRTPCNHGASGQWLKGTVQSGKNGNWAGAGVPRQWGGGQRVWWSLVVGSGCWAGHEGRACGVGS